MKKRDVIRRTICMMLALTLLFAALPMNILAAEDGAVANNLETPNINSTNTGNSNTSTNGGVDTPSEPNKYPTSSGTLPEDQDNPNDELIGDIITTEDGYRIQMNGDGESYSIIEYFGVSKNVVIPSSYRGKPITKILDSAFYGNKTAQKITIPESVVFIGEYTFYNLSESYVYNEYGQGKYIGSTNNPYYYFVAPKDKNATEITLHDDTAIVGSYAFAECENIKTVTIGNNVISMGYAVFGKDSKVENITIPFIGENGKTEYNAHFGYIFGARTTGGNISYVPRTLKEVTINGGSYVEHNAMYGVDMIESLTLPFLGESADDTETNYLSYIFGGTSYEDNIIPQTLTKVGVLGGEIGYGAFYKCVRIEEIVLHNIEYIREYAFSECTSLVHLELPDSIVNVAATAFYSCSKLPYNQYDNARYLGNSKNPYLVLVDLISSTDYISSCVIHSETRVIKDSAFANSDIYTFGVLNIPSSVRHIGEKAFYNCGFYYVNLPQNLQTIGASAFENCKYLQSVYIYKNVSQMGYRAFYGCTKLSEVGFEEGSALESIAAYTFYQCKALNYLPVPEGVVSIGAYAFDRNSYNSAAVAFPSTLRYIGQRVFGTSDYASHVTIRYNGSENDWYQNVFKDTNNDLYDTTVNFLIDNSEYSGFLFATNGDGTCNVRGYQGQVPDCLVIPEKSPIGESVVGIGYESFHNCSNIISVILPSTLITIGQLAFEKCSNIISIDIPNGVCTIESGAFAYCSSLESVDIPSGCVITSGAFYGCNNLIKEYGNAKYVGSYENPYYVLVEATSTSITSCDIHSSAKVILSRAFAYCSSLAEITIPKNIEHIGFGAFNNCTALEMITLPFIGSRREIDDNTSLGYIFAGYSWQGAIGSCAPISLKKVVITDIDTVGAYAFEGCTYITSIVLPSDVKSIGERAFLQCTSLNDITIPDGISRIESGTFYVCSSLTEIDIPSSVTFIGDQAFDNCSELKNVIIPNAVTYIGSFAFYGCNKIEEIVIPNNVKTIETQAFSCCTNLKRVLFEDDSCIEYVDRSAFSSSELLEYNVYDEANYLGSAENPYLVLVKSSVWDRTMCTIHPDTKLILANAFNSHEKLESIYIPKNVKIIGDAAFEYCYALNEISFESNSSLERIGYNAFRNCGALVEITIPKSVKIIGSYAFYRCQNINAVYFESGSRLNAIEDYAFGGCYKLISIVIPDYVNSIGVYAFAGCTNLAKITIGSGCAAINDYAFSGCTGLSDITLPNGITFIGSSIFNRCTNLVNVYYDGEENEWRHVTKATDWDNGVANTTLTMLLKERALLFETSDDIEEFYISGYNGEGGQVEAPSQYSGRPVTVVYERAFDGNKLLTSISLPESILVIGKFAFRNCTNLEKIEFPQNLNTIEQGILSGCTSIEQLTIPFLGAIREYEDDEFVGYYFGANDYTENVLYVPHTLRSITVITAERISDYCFNDCIGLVDFVIPDDTVSVGVNILSGCSRIESVTIGKNLQEIADYNYNNPLFGLDKSNSMLVRYIVSTDNDVLVTDEYGVLYRKMDIPYTAGTESVRVEIIDVPAMANLAGYAIPDHIVSIAPYAFAYNATLRMIDLTYVRNISNNAFYQASNLINVTLGTPIFTEFEREEDFNSAFDEVLESMPEGMWEQVYSQYIGDSAFRGCHSLLKIDIDTDNIVGIGDYAFADCPNLKTVMLGKNIERLGLAVFSATANGDSNIERFVVDEDNVHFKSIDGVLYSVNLDSSLTLEIFPAMAVELDSYGEPMYNDDGTNVYKYTFELPYDVYVKAIQTYAFQGTRELHTVNLYPVADMIVGDYAFANSQIREVNIGDNVVSLGLIRGEGEYTVFADANYLTKITVTNNNDYYSSIDGVLFDKQQKTLIKYPADKTVSNYDIPESVKTIASMAFKQNQKIQRVNVHSYVETVGFEAFYACGNLSFVNFENVYAPYSIMENAFTTQVEIEDGTTINPKVSIGYSLGYYYDGESGEIGWENYANTYKLIDNSSGEVIEPSPEVDRNNFYAVVVLDTEGKQLGNMLVSLTDPYGKTETVRTGYGTEGTGTAMFYDLAGVEGLGFALDFTQPYIIKVADQRGVYYTYESTSVYLDADMRITYITLERKPCDISFNVNGGVGHIDTMDILIDGNYAIANDQVSRVGYTLAGWGTSPDGVVKYTDFFSTSKYKAHYILYAIWQPNTNTVHFDTNTGVGSMSDITVKTDASVTLPENLFAKEGYEFIGWALTPTGGVVYADNGVFTSGVDSEYTLYAKWKGNENLFQFTAGGGDGSMDTGTVVTDEYTTVPQNGFTRDGYTFVDWVDDNGMHWNPGDSYKGTTKPVQTLTAQWVANTGTLRFDANGGSGTIASIELKTDEPTTLPKTEFGKLGYVMIGWATTSDGAPSYDSRASYKMPPVENGEVVTLYAVWAKGPAMHGVACDLADINTQTFDLNKAQYDYYCPISGTHNHEEGIICENGTLHEVVRISVIVYCDTSLGYSLVGKDGVADIASGLYQNGNKVAGVSDVFVNANGTAIVYFDVPVYTLLSEVDIVASLVLMNEHEEKAKCETVLNIHVFEFSVTEDDVDLETDAINVDLGLAGEAFEKLFGSDSFDISFGKNVKFTTEIDGDTIELLLKASKNYSKTSVTGDYKKGYTDNHGNHNKNTYFFQYKGTVKDSDGVKHELVYNIRFARATETDNYYYYRCYVYEGNYNNKITEFYGAVNGLSKQKSTRAELAPKAYLIYQSYHLSAKNVKDIDKIKKLGSDAHYIEGIQKAPHIENKHSFDMGLEGKLVFQYDSEKGLTPVSSRIKGTMEYTFNHNSQFVVWVIPIVLEVEVKVGGEIVLNISFDEDQKVTFDDTTLTLTASLNASAGVGCSVASFGVYGSIGTVFVLDIYPEFGIESWKANGEIGGYVKVLFKKYSKKFASFDGYIIEPKDQQQAMMLMSTYDMAAMYLIDNYTNAEASELENDFKLIVIDGMLYKLGYTDASSLEGYDAYNYAKLCISSWDGEKWSEPIIIDDNGRNDAAYSIYNHDGALVLTYTQVADILTANDDNYESFDNLVIKTIPLTTQSIATIGEGNVVDTSIERDYYVYLAQYAIVDGIPTLVWVENADNNAFGVSPDNYIDSNGISHVFATTANSIWMSKFENGTWGTPISIASGLSAVTDVAIGTDGNIAYIVDTNGNLADMTDRVMFYGSVEETISAYNHISVGSIISVDFAGGKFVYYYDLVNEDDSNVDGLRTLSSIENSGDLIESYPAEVPADYKVVEDAEGNVIAVFFFSTQTWEHYGEKVSGSALYGIFKQDGVWGKPIEIIDVSNESSVRFETTMDRYIYSYDVVVTPGEDSALMISVSTVDQNGCYLENYDFIYRMEGRIVVDNYEVNYADSTVSVTVRNAGARTSEVYISIGNGYLLIDEALASGEIKTYTVSLYGNADREYTVSVDGDMVGTADWTSEKLNLNYSDIVPYAKQLLIGGKNVLLLAVKNTGNTVDTGITVIRVGEHMENAIISAEIRNAISNLTLNDGESVIVEIVNENGEKEKIWVGKNEVDAYGIAYHEVLLSNLCSENIGIISIATIVPDPSNEKGVAVDNNFTYVSYNECVGSLEEGETVEYKPTIFENTLEFDQQNDDSVEFNYTYSADDYVLEVLVDQIRVSNELYENTINGTRGTIVLHLELLNSLSKGTHKVTLNFASGNTCEVELKVASYYTVTLKDGDAILEEVVVKEGIVPVLPTVSKAADEQYTYAFIGWDVDGDMIPDNITAVTENSIYTAIWKEIKREYEITWVMISADGKSVSVTEKYHYEEIPIYLGTIFVPDGMQFVSWNAKADAVTQNCTYIAQYVQERRIGDINGDGVVNTRDVAMLRQYVVGKIELSEDVLVYCNIYDDYNDDGSAKINTRDVALLQQIVVGTSN